MGVRGGRADGSGRLWVLAMRAWRERQVDCGAVRAGEAGWGSKSKGESGGGIRRGWRWGRVW